jgi:hypothetical protein
MKSLIEKIHFSDEAPENQNVRLKSLKRNLVEVSNSQNWVIKDANEAMETMIKKGNRLLNSYFYDSNEPEDEQEDSPESQIRDRIEGNLMEMNDKNSKRYFALRRRILAMIVDHSVNNNI